MKPIWVEVLLNSLKNYSEASKDIFSAILINQNNETYYYYEGLVNLAIDNYYGAQSDFSNAIRINPKYADAYYRRGLSKHIWYVSTNLNITGYKDNGCDDLIIAKQLGNEDAYKAIEKYCQ